MYTQKKIRKFILICMILLISCSIQTPTTLVDAQARIKNHYEFVLVCSPELNSTSIQQYISSILDYASIIDCVDQYYLIEGDSYQTSDDCITRLENSTMIQSASLNQIITTQGLTSDYYSDTQWALNNTGSYTYYSSTTSHTITSTLDVDLDIKETWNVYPKIVSSPHSVIVAIIDTGVDYQHKDLQSHMWRNTEEILEDGIDNDGNGYIDDVYGWDFFNNDNTVCHYKYVNGIRQTTADPNDDDNHGTHCAGIIAATANNGTGIAGIASNIDVQIMSLKIIGGNSSNNSSSGSTFHAIKAIKYAEKMGAKICNMSWGFPNYDAALETAMKESSMLFVSAAGNNSINNNSTPCYPSSFELPNEISVAAIDADANLCAFSNYGTNSVDLAAPGEHIFSTIVGSYAYSAGTSMAAPHISAIAALLYSMETHLYPQNIRDIILSSCKYYPSLDGYVNTPGIPSALVCVASRDALQPDYSVPRLSISTKYNKTNITLQFNALDVGSGVRTIRYLFGEHNLATFEHGTKGSIITNDTLSVSKGGYYTFYISDYAGNELVHLYYVQPDTIAPTMKATYRISDSYRTKKVIVKVTDSQSGVKSVKYLKGKKTLEDFQNGSLGTSISLTQNGYGKFYKTTAGYYTIYSCDYAGNKAVRSIYVKIIKATDIELNYSSKKVYVNSYFTLNPALTPNNSTDQVTYTSSNPNVATVDSTGKVTGVKKGSCTIIAKASSGVTTSCKVTVYNRPS